MDPESKKLLTDKAIIVFGAMAVLGGVLTLILSKTGKMDDSNSAGAIVIGAIFVWYGRKALKIDKERFGK